MKLMLKRKVILLLVISVFRWQFTINIDFVSILTSCSNHSLPSRSPVVYHGNDCMIKNILFDLDGTLSDSREGIIGCFQYTVSRLSNFSYSGDEILGYVGIPLRTILGRLLATDDRGKIDSAAHIYREKFAEIGITGNTLYPGIQEMLSLLHDRSCKLFVVTMKNNIDAGKVIDYLQLSQFFTRIYGPSPEGIPDTKALLIESALCSYHLNPDETVMIGDRKEDITAGKITGTKTVGVMWGFGIRQEIEASGPDSICEAVEEIPEAIAGLPGNLRQ